MTLCMHGVGNAVCGSDAERQGATPEGRLDPPLLHISGDGEAALARECAVWAVAFSFRFLCLDFSHQCYIDYDERNGWG
jgi:hypothetical protein